MPCRRYTDEAFFCGLQEVEVLAVLRWNTSRVDDDENDATEHQYGYGMANFGAAYRASEGTGFATDFCSDTFY